MFYFNSSAKEFYSIALMPTNDRNDRVMSQILNTDIGSIDILKQLPAGVPLQSDLLSIVVNMLKCTDEKIFEVFKFRHQNNDHYKEYKRNIFLPVTMTKNSDHQINFDISKYFPTNHPSFDINLIRYIFVPFNDENDQNNNDNWKSICVDCN